MPYPSPPDEITPQQRRREIAQILAAGILRLRLAARAQSAAPRKTATESSANRLEDSEETVLSVGSG